MEDLSRGGRDALYETRATISVAVSDGTQSFHSGPVFNIAIPRGVTRGSFSESVGLPGRNGFNST
ncbi:protein of unknown function [Methylococcus capsulatus]|uniref:Uncharacterized protein n=1 Tax=Methylococcus capsulatus TaxID=414 RepID=A0AA35XZD1_METCP|nr:protein of unknown function [Methylococcus capsulatus]